MNTNTDGSPIVPTAAVPAKKRSGRTKGSVSFSLVTIKDLLASGKFNETDSLPIGRKFLASRGITGNAQYARAAYATLNPAAPAATATDGATPTPKVQVTVTDLDAVQS